MLTFADDKVKPHEDESWSISQPLQAPCVSWSSTDCKVVEADKNERRQSRSTGNLRLQYQVFEIIEYDPPSQGPIFERVDHEPVEDVVHAKNLAKYVSSSLV